MTGSIGGATGAEMFELAERLYPIGRSLTGDGVRETLRELEKHVPLELHEVPTGTPVFDWTIPREWNVRDAYVLDPRGARVVDFQRSNLHLVGYSIPVETRLSLDELRPHLHSLPDRPELVPYRTAYYADTWGFCLAQRDLDALEPGEYTVCVDSTLDDGALTYGDVAVPGRDPEAGVVLVHTHTCHPSLANDNVSGLVVTTMVARALADRGCRHSFRFVFAPGTIGALTWLSRNPDVIPQIVAGLVVNNVGDRGSFRYKRSRRGDARIDRIAEHVLRRRSSDARIDDFEPIGYDERQYCAPGFDLPVGAFSRSSSGQYPEYHTSGDDLDLIGAPELQESVETLLEIVDVLDGDVTYRNTSPYGEPRLGARGLYPSTGGAATGPDQAALLWVLNLSDGAHSLFDVAARSGLPFAALAHAADSLVGAGLLEELDP
jgi:aminopeptidase-like protein